MKINDYGYIHPNNIGRIYSKNSSLQKMPSNLKYLFFVNKYKDFDLVSSSFSILLEYARINHLEENVPILFEYISSKKTFIKKIAEDIINNSKTIFISEASIDEEILTKSIEVIIKKTFIVYSNKNPGDRPSLKLPAKIINLIMAFQREISYIRNHIIANRNVLEKLRISTTTNNELKIQNLYVHTIESQIIEFLIEELNVKSYIPMFDGLLFVPNKNLEDLSVLNEKLRENFNFKFILIKEKQLKCDMDILNHLQLDLLKKQYFHVKSNVETILLDDLTKFSEQYNDKFFNFDLESNKELQTVEKRFEKYNVLFQSIEEQKSLYILSKMSSELRKQLILNKFNLESIRI